MSEMHKMSSDKLTTSERKELDTSEFGIPELREFPIHDASGMLLKSIKRSWHVIYWQRHICLG